jgi:hypothetical protein
MTKITNLKIGDLFEIPLSDGRKAYGQFVYENMGSIIRIFDYFTSRDEEADLNKIDTSKLLFPPIHAGIHLALKLKMWKIIGRLPYDDYVFKGFLNYNEVLPLPADRKEPVRIKSWALWDGKKSIPLGEKLPEEYQHYEDVGIYPPDFITKRIETGWDMFQYPKKHNRFLTEEEIKKNMKSN